MTSSKITNGPGAVAVLRAMSHIVEHQRGADPVHFSLNGYGRFDMSIYSVEREPTPDGSTIPYSAYLTIKGRIRYGDHDISITITNYDPHERTGWVARSLELNLLHQNVKMS
ncbi:MAG: hypothetical protein RLZZ347_776 [Candidatus Parcubacteria bacterium]|jgi:hypothetical protein